MVMHQRQSKMFHNPTPNKHNLASSLAIAAGVAISLGLINITPPQTNRFHFEQQIGEHKLSGTFEGTDTNGNGVLELSELESFEASWGDYTWTKEDLEAFSWGNKGMSQNPNPIYGINGLNFFARNRQNPTTHALQVWNREVRTPEGQSKNQGVYGIEYATNTSDNTLFSQEQLPIVVHQVQSQTDGYVLMMLLLIGSAGVLILNPCFLDFNTPNGEPCSSGKI